MVTAGADVHGSDKWGETVSHLACEFGHEELWREVLAKCGYDPDEVYSLENDFRHMYFQRRPGVGVFVAATPDVRSTKLSFKEYGRQRKSLDCVRKVYSREEVNYRAVWKECKDIWETRIETSDSEDCEWMNVRAEGRRIKHKTEKRKRSAKKAKIPEGYPKLLHDGVPWQIAFS